jgi:hypothetical protein
MAHHPSPLRATRGAATPDRNGGACPAKPIGEDGLARQGTECRKFPVSNVKQQRRHCERSEAIQNTSADAVWIASSLALLAMTERARLSIPAARSCPCLAKRHPRKHGGSRECRALDAPAAARAKVESTRVSHHRSTETIRHSLHDGLTAYVRALPGVPGFLASVACELVTRKLDPSVGGSGPRVFTARIDAARPAPPTRPSHPAPNVRDDREPPLL